MLMIIKHVNLRHENQVRELMGMKLCVRKEYGVELVSSQA